MSTEKNSDQGDIGILNSHDLLPSDLAAQSVEER